MKKKEYIKPEVEVVMVDANNLLAGSSVQLNTIEKGDDDDMEGWQPDSNNKLWVD